jgi:hypothetical protein
MTTLLDGLVVPKYYTEGYGYSHASGPPVGGFGPENPYIYSSTFYGSDVKGLFPANNSYYGHKKKLRRRKVKKNKRSKKRSS